MGTSACNAHASPAPRTRVQADDPPAVFKVMQAVTLRDEKWSAPLIVPPYIHARVTK